MRRWTSLWRVSGLYLKLFLWLWAVIALLITTAILLPEVIRVDGVEAPAPLRDEALGVARKVERGLAQGRPLRGGRHQRRLYLLDEQGEDLFHRPMPESLLAIDHQVGESDQIRIWVREQMLWLGPVEVSHQGQSLRLYILRPLPPGGMGTMMALSSQPLLLLGALLLVSVLACLLLVRAITRPIGQLSQTADALGAGQLAERPSQALLDRHDEIGVLARRFNGMADSLVAELENQKQLLRYLSHEFRTPLTRLRLTTALLRRQPDEALLARTEQEIERLDALIGQVIALSRGQRSDVETAPLPFAELVQAVVEAAVIEHSQLQLHTELEPLTVRGNALQLHALVENLLRNAQRFAQQQIRVTLQRDVQTNDAVLRVEDDGPGVAESDLKRLFEPFVTLDQNNAGSGLGLAIVHSTAQQHSGQVCASPSELGGLAVEVRLPLHLSAGAV